MAEIRRPAMHSVTPDHLHGEIQGVGSTTAFTDFIMSKSGSGPLSRDRQDRLDLTVCQHGSGVVESAG
jgi:hypothetical protein